MGPIETVNKNASSFINGWLFQHAVMLLVQESKDLDKLQGSLFRARETFTDWKDIASDVLKQKREINQALSEASIHAATAMGIEA